MYSELDEAWENLQNAKKSFWENHETRMKDLNSVLDNIVTAVDDNSKDLEDISKDLNDLLDSLN